MSDSPMRIILIAILLIVVFAFIFVFLYLGMQAILAQEQQKAASSEESETEITTWDPEMSASSTTATDPFTTRATMRGDPFAETSADTTESTDFTIFVEYEYEYD